MVAERIRFAIDKKNFRVDQQIVKITINIGVVGFDPALIRDKDDFMNRLEKILDQAQRSGPNQIAVLSRDVST